MTTVEVIGVYDVEAPEPCHLVEVLLTGCEGRFDVGDFIQPDNGPRSGWQAAYAEKLLSSGGDALTWDLWDGPGGEDMWRGDVRLVFFLHYLDSARPLSTPFGEVEMPAPSARPARLARIEYEEP